MDIKYFKLATLFWLLISGAMFIEKRNISIEKFDDVLIFLVFPLVAIWGTYYFLGKK